MEKKAYKQPILSKMGSIIKETKGKNGSSIDGGGTYTQTGGGND